MRSRVKKKKKQTRYFIFLECGDLKVFYKTKGELFKIKEEIESFVVLTVRGFAACKFFSVIVVKIQLDLRCSLFQFRKLNEGRHMNGESFKFVRIVRVCLIS